LAGRRRGNTAAEIVVVLVVAALLTASALPMYARYSAALAVNSARGDLKAFQSAVEAYYTEHLEVPHGAGEAVAEWTARYVGRYSYRRLGAHDYEFSTRAELGGVRLWIDETGVVGQSK